ncbi:hypothetical protein PF001_g33437 [Phytophthora fragariae]|uniref:Uncharacterized protein n=1 Tax=Phytophthora fragariae TaxID=53985 RepID=A0A6A4ABS0_9STRA|nr:hypothetical protein PF001_g33437 [Phytophthora fragariae]
MAGRVGKRANTRALGNAAYSCRGDVGNRVRSDGDCYMANERG